VPILHHWIIGCCSGGVSFACKNWWPASSRHAFSSMYLEENSCWSPSVVGPITACSVLCLVFICSADRTSLAVLLAFSVCQCCFQRDFVAIPLACAWAWIKLVIQVSRQSGLALSMWELLYATWICSWMVKWSRWKLLGWMVMPPFFALCLRTELPISHPFNQLWRPFQYSIRFIALDTCPEQVASVSAKQSQYSAGLLNYYGSS